MEGSLFLSLKYEGRGKLIVANKKTTFEDVLQIVRDEWQGIPGNQVYLTSSVASLVNCSLKCDQDLHNLFLFCDQLKEKVVIVDICNVSPSTPPQIFDNIGMDSPSHKLGEQEKSLHKPLHSQHPVLKRPHQNSDEFEGWGSLPISDVSPVLEKKPLLNDGWGNLIRGNGQVFKGGAADFRHSMIKYTEKLGFRFDFNRNDSRYVHVVCAEREDHGCQWFVKAGRQPYNSFFVINSSNLVHGCVGKLVSGKKSRLGAAILGPLFTEKVRQDPTAGGKDVKSVIKTSYGLDVTYSRAHRTLEYSRGKIFGSYVASYKHLPWYSEAIKRTNPNSVVVLESEPDSNCFKRIFIAFKALLEGFKSCRPMLFIDGTFMTGRTQGTILAATAKDGNNGLYPVAFAVVSGENLENWTWFLEMVRDNVKHPKEIFYISDRNTGLMSAFPRVFEKPVHFFCLQHLNTNLKKQFGGKGCAVQREKMWEHFKEAAYAPTVHLFNEKMKIFKDEGGQRAAEWIDTLPVEKWSLAHSSHIIRYGEMMSNAIESFNFWIVDARALPVTYMIDCIRIGLMRWFVERRNEGNKWKGALCQHKEEHWNALSDMGATWNVLESTSGNYEVLSEPSVQVNLQKKCCSCYQWQIRGFPCAHAVAVIRKVCDDISDVVDDHFTVATYKKCYSGNINPIPQTEKFECLPLLADNLPMLPPENATKLGRPPNKRKKSVFEIRTKKKPSLCPKCGLVTKHDIFTCGLAVNKHKEIC